MKEAESLCDKIGILVNGKFVGMGTTDYLKHRYEMGYKLTFSVDGILSKEDFE